MFKIIHVIYNLRQGRIFIFWLGGGEVLKKYRKGGGGGAFSDFGMGLGIACKSHVLALQASLRS